jgi:protocatechuate 3,4-dioxygenase beta subunit
MRILLSIAVAAVACRADAAPREVLVGGPCQGCELVFEGRPAKLASAARIAPTTEPGEPLVLEGVVRDRANRPVAGVIVYAYHTDATGKYPPGKTRHGALRGFAITAKDGTYRFDTIRPASYPNTRAPQHMHMHVVEPGRCHYVIDDVVFDDDPLLTAELRESMARGRGGRGIAKPTRDKQTWRARRDITLGAGIADYDRCRS